MNKKDYQETGVVTLAVPMLLLVIIAAVVFILISQGIVKNPLITSSKQPSVSLQKQYQNPFDKSAQYVNPFSSYKNPFDLLKSK